MWASGSEKEIEREGTRENRRRRTTNMAELRCVGKRKPTLWKFINLTLTHTPFRPEMIYPGSSADSNEQNLFSRKQVFELNWIKVKFRILFGTFDPNHRWTCYTWVRACVSVRMREREKERDSKRIERKKK